MPYMYLFLQFMMYFLQNLLIVLLISHYSLCIHGLSSYSTGQSLQLDKKQSNFETTSNHNQKKTNLKSRYSLSPTSKSKGITNERVLNKSDKSETNLASSSSFITKSNLLSICLSIAYASIIVDTITLPAGLLLIKTELGLDKSFSFSKMMFAATMATMVGKLILGPPTDYFGGELTMKASMAGMTVLLLLCSITTNMNQLAPLWIAINFIYATAWGACGKVVRERFPSSEWGVQLGFISGASRIASVLAALGFGQLLHSGSLFGIKTSSLVVGGKWREIFKMSAIFQAFVLLLYIVIDRFFISIGSLNSIGTSNKGIKESTTTTMVRSSVKSSIHKNNVKTTTIYSTYTETFVYRLVLVSSQLTLALARHCRKRLQVISGVIVYLFHNLSQVSGQAFSVVCASIQSILSRVSQNWNQVRSKTSQIKVNTRIPTTNIAKTQSQSRLMKRNIVVSTNLPYHKNSINNINRLSSLAEEDENVYQVLSRVTSYPSFWLMLVGKASLLMVGQFIAFMPAYLGTEPLLLCTPSEASKISSFFAFGSFISSIFGTLVYTSLRQHTQILLVIVCNLIATGIPIFLTMSRYVRLDKSMMIPLLTLWGMCWALPFYVPPGLFVLSLSRPHAALLTNIYDAVGFMLGAFFSYFAIQSVESRQWKGSFYSLAFASFITSISMNIAMTVKPKQSTNSIAAMKAKSKIK